MIILSEVVKKSAPKGQKQSAQGIALGRMVNRGNAPKGQKQSAQGIALGIL
jgi:hypothetical protein